jgi:hypothetical protein
VAPIVDFEREGLFDELERAERLMLLKELCQDGVPVQELRRRTGKGTLVFLPAERMIAGRERYTAAKVADLAGADLGFLLAARRTIGLPVPGPDEHVYIEADLETVRTASVATAAGVSEEEILELMRTLDSPARGVAMSVLPNGGHSVSPLSRGHG